LQFRPHLSHSVEDVLSEGLLCGTPVFQLFLNAVANCLTLFLSGFGDFTLSCDKHFTSRMQVIQKRGDIFGYAIKLRNFNVRHLRDFRLWLLRLRHLNRRGILNAIDWIDYWGCRDVLCLEEAKASERTNQHGYNDFFHNDFFTTTHFVVDDDNLPHVMAAPLTNGLAMSVPFLT
jgi:hypothetical protein